MGLKLKRVNSKMEREGKRKGKGKGEEIKTKEEESPGRRERERGRDKDEGGGESREEGLKKNKILVFTAHPPNQGTQLSIAGNLRYG